ncbi:hypothetical protein ABFS82_11G119700 [Erythranthe guttata]|nr:PREDICTED: UDP-glycosyltransferase 83A1-like [Erythranthe guttata]|eukprot:XP_012840592.1 PREDICTED: UDP-glycosyltransferase 83A1-like [Erythranthe guttata]
MAKAHVMMVPFPMHGHVIPLLELAKSLAKHGTKITFVNTEIIHERIFNIDRHKREALLEDGVRLVSVSDGLESNERYIPGKLMEAVYKVIPQKIEELIREIDDTSKEDRITCIIYDQSIGSIQKVAGAMGIRSAAFLPAAAASLVLGYNIPNLIEDGIIDGEGAPLSNKPIQFSPTMPIMTPSDFVWHRIKIPTVQKLIFNIMIQNNIATSSVDRLICNSIHDLEPGAFASSPQIIPIGPLLENSSSLQGHFRQNDSNKCLEWLDRHPTCSVIYVAFGSLAMFNKAQFQELAVGLEITEMPFLWVVRPDNRNFPEGFSERVSSRGKIVEWAPQQKILSHPSIACFVSHCGWNSTVESVSNGVPILCWPYFADQFINQSYICDIWKIGLKFENDDVTSGEIKDKIRRLIEDCAFKETALCLREKIEISAREGGNSYNNLKNFITWIKN